MSTVSKITPCLWFDDQAEQAANFYISVFGDGRIVRLSHYGEEGQEIHGRPAGSVLTVAFELQGQSFTALNGGPMFRFNEAISLQVYCDTQDEIDHYWNQLSAGGDPAARQCGWLKDRYGVSWQVVPSMMDEWITGPDRAASGRVMAALLKMKKLDIAGLEKAFSGPAA